MAAVKGRKSRYSGLTMVRAVGVPGLAAFNCHSNIIENTNTMGTPKVYLLSINIIQDRKKHTIKGDF